MLTYVCHFFSNFLTFCCEPPGLPQGSLGPFRPEVSSGVSPRVSSKTGVSEGVSHGESPPGPFGPRARACPKSVPRVSPQCLAHLFGTPRTLSGTFWDTSRDTPSDTPVFEDILGDTSGPKLKGPRDPCSRLGGSQIFWAVYSIDEEGFLK